VIASATGFLPPLPYPNIGTIGWYFIGLQVLMAWMSFRSRGKVAALKTLPSRTRHFTSTLIIQGLLLTLSLLVAYKLGITLFPRVVPTPLHLVAGVAVAGLLASFMYPQWKHAVARGARRLYFFMPQGPKEKGLWVSVSLVAGFGEECTYRGVLYVLFCTLTGSAWAGALLSALVFAGGHAFQSLRSMIIIFFFSLVFQALALWSGALYVSMLAHALYDVTAGFSYSRLGRAMGYRAEGEPTAAPAS
jgi:membrane protease YdiL (CAAX protease family)